MWLAQQQKGQETIGSLPTRARSFLDELRSLDVRRATVFLQTILQTAHVYKDGRTELEFRA